MSDDKNFRFERIEKLLHELRWEVERGIVEGDLESESIGFRHVVGVSHELPGGMVLIRFETRPIHRHSIMGTDLAAEPKLTVIKGGKQ